ncbi:hypothetical protein [Novosphingobium sp. 11B]
MAFAFSVSVGSTVPPAMRDKLAELVADRHRDAAPDGVAMLAKGAAPPAKH